MSFATLHQRFNDSVNYMKEAMPIEIGVKPVNIETMKNDTSLEESE